MFRRTNGKPAACLLAVLLTLTWMPKTLAGGFQISVEPITSSTATHPRGTVLVVRTHGCRQPADASLSATAEGLVNGQRQSLPLQLTPISNGVYAIKRQWPSEGVWVLAITGTYLGHTSSALVELGDDDKAQSNRRVASGSGINLPVQIMARKLTPAEVDRALRAKTRGKALNNSQASASQH